MVRPEATHLATAAGAAKFLTRRRFGVDPEALLELYRNGHWHNSQLGGIG